MPHQKLHIPLIEREAKTKAYNTIFRTCQSERYKISSKRIKKFNNNKVVLLKCVSDYPFIRRSNLKSILEIKKKFKF